MKKTILNKVKDTIPFKTLIPIIALILVFASIFLRKNIISFAEETGKVYGNLVGSSIGFASAMANFGEYVEEGKKAGLDSSDITVDIGNEIKEMKKLDVLVASVKLSDIHTIGKNIDYAALYLVKGEVVFSVDFSKVIIKGNTITLPKPEGELFIDQSTVEKVSEYQRKLFNGSAEDGFDAYLNSMKKIQMTTTETLDNYDALLEAAKESAKKQIESIACSVSVNSKEYTISFTDEEDDKNE